MTYIHLQCKMYDVMGSISALCFVSSTSWMSFRNLLYNLIPIFIIHFMKAFIVQNWTWKFTFWHVLWLRTVAFFSRLSICRLTWHITSDMQGNGSIFKSLKISCTGFTLLQCRNTTFKIKWYFFTKTHRKLLFL